MRTFLLALIGFFSVILAPPCRAQVIVKGTVQDSLQRHIPDMNICQTCQVLET